MKNIYKDEVIGGINSNLIYNNEIKGVFGEIVDVSQVPRDNPNVPNILTSQQRSDDVYTYYFNRTRNDDDSYYFYPYPDKIQYYTVEAIPTFIFNLNLNFTFNYTNPVFNVPTPTARLYYDRYTFSGSTTTGDSTIAQVTRDIISFVQNNPSNTTSQPINTIIQRPQNANIQVSANQFFAMNISALNIERFKINFSASLNTTNTYRLYGRLRWGLEGTTLIAEATAAYDIIQPKYIEIVIQGDTYRITQQAFQFGKKENALEQPQSTLLTTKATYKGQPLWEHIGQRIVNQWENGKQVVSLPTIINSESDIREVNDETYIFNVRRGEIDESNQAQVNNASIFKTVDGKAKKFIIVNITNNYDGSMNQMLDLQEVIK